METNEIPSHTFASSIAEELWSVADGRAVKVECRTDRGFAFTSWNGMSFVISGSDSAQHCQEAPAALIRELDDASAQASERLRSVLDEALQLLRELRFPKAVRLRAFSRVRSVWSRSGSHVAESLLLALATGSEHHPLSVVSTPASLRRDLDLLIGPVTKPVDVDYRTVPLVFVNGSGSVLLHEAIGHPSQSGTKGPATLEWLQVEDDPSYASLGQTTVDDCGLPVQSTLLTGGRSPAAWRRESFRDVPARRMTNLVVRCARPVVELPSTRMEIQLVDGGHYDGLTDEVSLTVSRADLVRNDGRIPAREFTLVESREKILTSLLGSRGGLTNYPGVICFEEGHRIPVGSVSPDLLLEPLAG